MFRNAQEQTLYEILRVSSTATLVEIKQAYRQRCMEYHPDVNPGANNSTCHEMMCKINEAYRVLRDAEQRKVYDDILKSKNQHSSDEVSTSDSPSTQAKAQSEDFSKSYDNEEFYDYYNSVDFDEEEQAEFIIWMQKYVDSYLRYVIEYYEKYRTSKTGRLLERLYDLFENNIVIEKELSKRKSAKKMNKTFNRR